jgi:hypothetical protein
MSTKTEPNRKTYDLEFQKQAVQLVINAVKTGSPG